MGLSGNFWSFILCHTSVRLTAGDVFGTHYSFQYLKLECELTCILSIENSELKAMLSLGFCQATSFLTIIYFHMWPWAAAQSSVLILLDLWGSINAVGRTAFGSSPALPEVSPRISTGATALSHIHHLAEASHPLTWFFIPLLCKFQTVSWTYRHRHNLTLLKLKKKKPPGSSIQPIHPSSSALQSTSWICSLLFVQSYLSSCDPSSAAFRTQGSSGKAICTATAIQTVFMPFSPMVDRPPELCQSRGNPLFLQKALENISSKSTCSPKSPHLSRLSLFTSSLLRSCLYPSLLFIALHC